MKLLDKSVIPELKDQGFSCDYIKLLTSKSFNAFFKSSPGSKCNYGTSLPYKPSYGKIGLLTELCDPDHYEIKHQIEIINNEVFFNGVLLASSPDMHNNGKKFTSAQKLQFCKAVVFSIIPGEIKKREKNRHGNFEYIAVPDNDYLRELIKKYPPVIQDKEPEIMPVIEVIIEPVKPQWTHPYLRCNIIEEAISCR